MTAGKGRNKEPAAEIASHYRTFTNMLQRKMQLLHFEALPLPAKACDCRLFLSDSAALGLVV